MTPPSTPPAEPPPPRKVLVLVREALFAKYRWLPLVWEFIRKEYAGLKAGWLLFLIALLVLSYPAVRLWQYGVQTKLQAKVDEIQRQDRELASLRHENENLVAENNRLRMVLDPIERKAKELYPDLEASAAIAKLAKDLEETRNLATRADFKPLTTALREQLVDRLKQIQQAYGTEGIRFVIGYEKGNIGRAKLAQELSNLMGEAGMPIQNEGAGMYGPGSLDSPVKVLVNRNNDPVQKLGLDVMQAISRLLTSGVVGFKDASIGTNDIYITILGTPGFLPDGSVIFE